MEPMSAPTLVLISGFARAGKDTLAEGILEWSRRPSRKTSFASHLKDAANDLERALPYLPSKRVVRLQLAEAYRGLGLENLAKQQEMLANPEGSAAKP